MSPKFTVEGWIRRIADPELRKAALDILNPEIAEFECSSLESAINSAAIWKDTPQKVDFWIQTHNKAVRGEIMLYGDMGEDLISIDPSLDLKDNEEPIDAPSDLYRKIDDFIKTHTGNVPDVH